MTPLPVDEGCGFTQLKQGGTTETISVPFGTEIFCTLLLQVPCRRGSRMTGK